MLLVAGIDALGRIADMKIAAAGEAGCLLQHRQAILLDGAGIDRRLVDDDVALFQHAADGRRRGADSAEVGPAGAVDRRRHGDDIKVGAGQAGRLVLIGQRRLRKLGGFDLAGAVVAGAQFRHPLGVDVEADDGRTGTRKSDGHRQAHIAEADHRDFSGMRRQ